MSKDSSTITMPASLVEGVEVPLTVVISNLKGTIGSISSATKDATIQLSTSPSPLVELHLNGVTVARGELVKNKNGLGFLVKDKAFG